MTNKNVDFFNGKTLMITGGTGSFGTTVLKRFLTSDIGEIRIFSTYKQAKACFDKFVSSEKDNDPLMECDDKVIEESEDHFAIWQDGRYCENHYEINIVEKKVH